MIRSKTKPMTSSKKITLEEIKHVAKLANLPIDDKKVEYLAEQFIATVNFVDQLQEINTENVVPTSQVTGTCNVFREDKIDMGRVLTQANAIKNAPNSKNGYFIVSRILDQNDI